MVVDTLVELGFFIKRKTCVLAPSQHFFFLGYHWDTKAMLCTLPQEKLENIQSLCKQVLAKSRTEKELTKLQKLQGSIAHFALYAAHSHGGCVGGQEIIVQIECFMYAI